VLDPCNPMGAPFAAVRPASEFGRGNTTSGLGAPTCLACAVLAACLLLIALFAGVLCSRQEEAGAGQL